MAAAVASAQKLFFFSGIYCGARYQLPLLPRLVDSRLNLWPAHISFGSQVPFILNKNYNTCYCQTNRPWWNFAPVVCKRTPQISVNSHDECLWESIRFTCHLSSLVTLYYLLKRITFSRELEISLCFCKSECSFQIYWMPRYFHLKYLSCNYGNKVWSRFIVEKV